MNQFNTFISHNIEDEIDLGLVFYNLKNDISKLIVCLPFHYQQHLGMVGKIDKDDDKRHRLIILQIELNYV